MGESGEAPKKKGSCIGKLTALFVFGGLIGLGAAVFFILQPQDLSDLEGSGPGAVGKSSRDLQEVMQNALDGGYSLSLTEEEINLYLRDTLKAEQAGMLASQVSIRSVAVRLDEARAEVIIEREVAGRPLTLSMFLRVEQTELPTGTINTEIFLDGGPYHESLPWPAVGGRFGRLPVPQGFLVLVLPSFKNLAGVYRTDGAEAVKALDFIDEMARIRVEEGKLVLDPVPNTRAMPGGP